MGLDAEGIKMLAMQHQKEQYDNQQEDEEEDYRHSPQNIDQEMEEKLKMLNEEDSKQEEDEYKGEDDEDQLIDIDNLNDKEKVMLWQYLHDEYQKDPNSLPMDKETVEQFLNDNYELVQRYT